MSTAGLKSNGQYCHATITTRQRSDGQEGTLAPVAAYIRGNPLALTLSSLPSHPSRRSRSLLLSPSPVLSFELPP
uniref:Uncharacterized protein n=1 Tax=Oryza meridionalis TaxID=40149 RepID=A0A0E0CW27_9ORYZ